MIKTILSIGLFLISFFLLGFLVQAELKNFKGVSENLQETEVRLGDALKKDNFCCDRQIKTGDAHEPRYNIEALLTNRDEEASLLKKPSSQGKK